MRFSRTVACLLALVCASCGNATSSSTCTEYAAEIHEMIAQGAPAEELDAFIEDTEEHVAGLMMDDPDRAGPCVEAIFEALFAGAADEMELMLDG